MGQVTQIKQNLSKIWVKQRQQKEKENDHDATHNLRKVNKHSFNDQSSLQ